MVLSMGVVTAWLARLALCALCCSGQFHYNDVMKFESYNIRSYHMGFDLSLGSDGQMNANLSPDGKRFHLRAGLTGAFDAVSFESADFKGYYLRHHSTQLDLEAREGGRDQESFDADATFKGAHGHWFDGFMVFESVNYGGKYIRHRGNRLYVEEYDMSELFKRDASWRMSKGPFIMQPSGQYDCFPPCKLSMGINREATMSDTGTPIYIVSPGLDGNHAESVSFHHAKQPELYMRSVDGVVYFENSSDVSHNQGTFNQDASFAMRGNNFIDDYFAIEEIFGGRYMCRSDFRVLMKADDDSIYFVDDASFKTLEGPLLLEASDGLQVGVSDSQQGVMSFPGTRFNLVYPGLSHVPGTVSLESYEDGGQYLRHNDYKLDLEDRLTGRNLDMFDQDASFYVRIDVFKEGTVSLETQNYADHYLSHSNNQLMIQQYEDTADFRTAAAFTRIEASTDIEKDTNVPKGPNTSAIIGASCTVGLILLFLVMAFFVDRMLNRRKTAEQAIERQAAAEVSGIENPTYDGDVDVVPQAKTGEDRVVIDPLPSVSSLVKEHAPLPHELQRRPSITDRLRRSFSGSDNDGDESIPIRNSLKSKLRRLSNSFTRPDKSDSRRADIPTNFDIDFTKPFDFDAEAAQQSGDGNIGFGNPLFGQQPSRLSLTFDELPSPLDFNSDGFEAANSSMDNTPSSGSINDGVSFFDDEPDDMPVSFPPILKKAVVGSQPSDLYAEIGEAAATHGSKTASLFDDVNDPVPTPSAFPSIRRKSSDKRSGKEKRVSFPDVMEHEEAGHYATSNDLFEMRSVTVSPTDDLADSLTVTDDVYAVVDMSKKKKKPTPRASNDDDDDWTDA